MKNFILIGLFFITFSVEADVSDNKVKMLEHFQFIAKNYADTSNKDSALFYYDKAIDLAIEIPDSLKLTFLYRCKARECEIIGNYSQSLILYYKALSIANSTKQDKEQGFCYLGLSNINFRIANNGIALKQSIKAANIFEQIGDTSNFIRASVLMGQVYISKENYNSALIIYKETLGIAKELNDSNRIADVVDHIGVIYTFQEDYDLALLNHFEALGINEQIENNINLGINHANIGEIYMLKGENGKALFHLNTALKIEENEKFNSALIFIYYVLGETYSKMMQPDNALMLFNKSLYLIDMTGEKREKPYVYNLISEHYERNKDFKKSLIFQKKYSSERDSINNQANIFQIDELRIRYDVDKKEQEYKSLLLEKEVHEIELATNNNRIRMQLLIIFLVVAGLISSFIFTIYFIRSRSKLKKTGKTKDVLFSIIGHDLRGPMANIKQIVELLPTLDPLQRDKYIKTLKEPVEASFTLLEDLLAWSRSINDTMDHNPENIFVKDTIGNTFRLLQSIMETKNIIFEFTIPDNIQVFADKNHFSTIMRNLISNAIKFTPEDGLISINHKVEDSRIKIMVSDTGVGIEPHNITKILNKDSFYTTYGTNNEKGSGLGLVLCQNFIKMNKGKLGIESVVGKGSTFYFSLPMGKRL